MAMKFADVAENVGRLVESRPGWEEFRYEFMLTDRGVGLDDSKQLPETATTVEE